MKPALRALTVVPKLLIGAAGLLSATCFALAFLFEQPIYALIPFGVAGAGLVLYDYRVLYYLLLLTLPYSFEVAVPGGLSTDLPSEPLMIMLMASFLLIAPLTRPLPRSFILHPVCILLAIMLFWALISTFTSTSTLKSVKYLLAKSWYLVTFLIFTGVLSKSVNDIGLLLKLFIYALAVSVAICVVRHAQLGFAFDMVNYTVWPFFKNHVIYSATVALAVPYAAWLWYDCSKQGIWRYILLGICVLLVVGVGFSYTRASWLALLVLPFYYLVLRFNLTRLLLLLLSIGTALAVTYLVYNNNYKKYSPDFEKTVYNGENLEKHLEATYNFEDVSGMERVYRWVAAFRMAAANPITGTGPSTFYPEYKKYTVRSFATYVSRNPEKSTAHNYFLLVMAEQGYLGLLLFVILVFYTLLLCQRLFNTTLDPRHKSLALAATLCLVTILFHLLLNELIEVDKIGSFFFISLAILIRINLWNKTKMATVLAT